MSYENFIRLAKRVVHFCCLMEFTKMHIILRKHYRSVSTCAGYIHDLGSLNQQSSQLTILSTLDC